MINMAPTPEQLRKQYAALISEHRAWLAAFENWRLARWNRLLGSGVEGALHEALVRRFLSQHVQDIEPVEDRSSGGPDFKCTTPRAVFYVESTCLTIDAVTRKTKLSHLPTSQEVTGYHLLTQFIHGKCQEKAPKFSKNNDAPCRASPGSCSARSGTALLKYSASSTRTRGGHSTPPSCPVSPSPRLSRIATRLE